MVLPVAAARSRGLRRAAGRRSGSPRRGGTRRRSSCRARGCGPRAADSLAVQRDHQRPGIGQPGHDLAFSQVPNAAASAWPSSIRRTRRNLDRDGGTSQPRRSRRAPSASSTSGGSSDAHSAIAVTESAPAITAATANASTTAARCRMPRLRRGSGRPSRHSSRPR